MASILEESKRSRGTGKIHLTKKKIIIAIIVVVVFTTGYYILGKAKTKDVNVAAQKEWTVKKGDLKISIESDGKVVAEDGVELSFSVSGNNLEIKEVFVKEGDKIKKGDKIATVETESLELSMRSVYSSYLSSLADYNLTLDGATDKQIAEAKDRITSAEISLEQGKISLESAKQSATDSIRRAEDSVYDAEKALTDAKKDLDDNRDELSSEAVNNAYESLVDTIKSTSISLEGILKDSDEILGIDEKQLNDDFENFLGVKNISSLSDAKAGYIKSKNELNRLELLLSTLNINSPYADVDRASEITILALSEFEKHLYDMKLVLESTITASGFSQSDLNGLVSTISSNRTSVNTKITTINSKVKATDDARDGLEDYINNYDDAIRDLENAKQDIVNARADARRSIDNSESSLKSKELSLEQTKRDYDDLIAPLTVAEIASARSRLTSASVSLERAKKDLENATILSPIDGEIARLNYKTGDIIVDNSSSDPVAVIINNDTLFIEVNIEEADINKIKSGQTAYATFGALDDLRLDGIVTFISLTSQTNNSGIVTYMVRMAIENKGEAEIREGMTAYVDFVTAEAKDVLTVPVAAVKNVNNSPSVLNASNEWLPVVTGFTDGKNVEVIKGLSAGDKILY